MTKENMREQVIAKAKAEFEMAVSNLIMAVGTDEAQNIMREMRRSLRSAKIEFDPYHTIL